MDEQKGLPGRRASVVAEIQMQCSNCGHKQVERLHRREEIRPDGTRRRVVDGMVKTEKIVCRNCKLAVPMAIVWKLPLGTEEWK